MPRAEPKPHLVSAATVSSALGDAKFYTQVPEFSTLRNKLKAMRVKIDKKTGCHGCKSRRVQQNLFKDFCSVLTSLNPGALQRFKKYLGAERLMLNTQDPVTGGVKLKML